MQEICLSRFQNKQQTYKTKFIQKLSVRLFHFSSLCHNWLHCSRVLIYATLPPLYKPTFYTPYDPPCYQWVSQYISLLRLAVVTFHQAGQDLN